MTKEQIGYRPGSGKKYDPDDPHFNPMYPPDGYPDDDLWKEWFGADWKEEKEAYEREQRERQSKPE